MKLVKGLMTCLTLGSLIFSSCEKDFRITNAKINGSQKNNLTRKLTGNPNIIFIVADDVGYENIQVDGGVSYITPNLNALAAEGKMFTECHSTPLCSPSRIEIITGKYNQRNYTQWGILSPSEKTIFNHFHDAGYLTCVSGKWQITATDEQIHAFGVDKYAVDDYSEVPYIGGDEVEGYSKYFHPTVFSDSTHGARWDSLYTNKYYGPDIFENYGERFMDTALAQGKPFFLYFSTPLCHIPFCPTPLNPQFASWIDDPWNKKSSSNFYKSMMAYMDILVGKLLAHADSLGISNNTIVVFIGDNGTPKSITSNWQNDSGEIIPIKGGKLTTGETGIRVPLFVKGMGMGIDSGLIDFPDFIYTLSDLAGISRPDTLVYGHLDAVSFADTANRRQWSFDAFPGMKAVSWKYWSETSTRKLYSTSGKLYSLQWPYPDSVIPGNELTPQDKQTKNMLNSVLIDEGVKN